MRAEVDGQIEALVGMTKVKEYLEGLRRKILFVESGGSRKVLATCMNLVLTGNPGVGKTTFARLLFKFLRAYGILKRDAFVEVNALSLKGRYVGQTAPKVIAKVREAMGGCLFLDEAYALAGADDGRSDSFGAEAVRTLLTEVENNRTGLLVILAGYDDQMTRLMSVDPGLPRRFPVKLHMPDYTPTELAGICE